MDYKQKYLKYKKKYLELKNQIGGYTLKLEEWKKIENSGQHNCGIFLSDIYPKYILKCENDYKLDKVIEINKTIQLFPKIINLTKIEEHAYITMQKLDGDITSIYFNLFPKMVLKNMITKGLINKKQEETLFDLFLGKCRYTENNSKSLAISLDKFMFDRIIDPEIHSLFIEYLRANTHIINKRSDINIKGNIYKDIYNSNIDAEINEYKKTIDCLDKIKKITDISLELYDIFMKQLIDLWTTYHEIITKEIIKIKLLLIQLGYNYNDDKFDNFGYILSNVPIDDFRKFQAPKIFGKYYLYVYFLDWESGLSVYKEEAIVAETHLVDDVNNGFSHYNVHGQYNITKINDIVIRDQSKSEDLDLLLLGINPEILKILQKRYVFDLSRFKHSFTTIEDVKKFIYN